MTEFDEFDEFDVSQWQPNGVLLEPVVSRGPLPKRRTVHWAWVLAAGVMSFATVAHGAIVEASDSSASAFSYQAVPPRVDDADRVPAGYWRKLIARMREMSPVVEASDVVDPEPFV